jgi:hypothetical protein
VYAWETFFMLVVLKIPIVYLCIVVWWAIKAAPEAPPADGDGVVVTVPPETPCGWRARSAARRCAALRRRPVRRPTPRPGLARAEARR